MVSVGVIIPAVPDLILQQVSSGLFTRQQLVSKEQQKLARPPEARLRTGTASLLLHSVGPSRS